MPDDLAFTISLRGLHEKWKYITTITAQSSLYGLCQGWLIESPPTGLVDTCGVLGCSNRRVVTRGVVDRAVGGCGLTFVDNDTLLPRGALCGSRTISKKRESAIYTSDTLPTNSFSHSEDRNSEKPRPCGPFRHEANFFVSIFTRIKECLNAYHFCYVRI